jgi:hypothetical protein
MAPEGQRRIDAAEGGVNDKITGRDSVPVH